MLNVYTIEFPGTAYLPLQLENGQNLSEHLTVHNSPVLFGCRTGLCGTCLVGVVGEVVAPGEEEQEILDNLAPGNPSARLACQINLSSDLQISSLTK